MVYPHLCGRYGNQIIESMCAISYALKHGLEYHIPDSTVNNEVWPPFFRGLKNEKFNPALPTIKMKEGGRSYFEIPFEEEWREMNIELDGYWQSYPYFIEHIEDIKRIFKLPSLLMGEMASCHIRRGDFLAYPTLHPVINENYLDAGISELRDRHKVPLKNIIVSTDDITWAKHFFKKRQMDVLYAEDILNEVHQQPHNAIYNWYLMNNCKYHLISNSTYSYTAAILCDRENKVVITPHEDNWYGSGNKKIDVSSLLPKEWIRIKY